MKKTTLLLLFISFVTLSCNSLKTTEKALNTGDYEKAIALSIKKLAKNKYKAKNQPYVITLQNAFFKATNRDLEKIDYLKKEANSANLEAIYTLYHRLKNRQEKIKPLLPLTDVSTGKIVDFNLVNYDTNIIEAKENYADYLYQKGVRLLNTGYQNKMNYRNSYTVFTKLNKISPNYKNTNDLQKQAHLKGTDYIFVSLNNQTNQIIPRRLEADLLALDTYGLNNLWTVYHAEKNSLVKYDFDVELNLRSIVISPEKIHEKEIIKEKQLKDGFKYLKDNKGGYVKDSLGVKIKVDNFKTIRCQLYHFTQFKSSKVAGIVKYFDNSTNQLIESFPIDSEFIFEHIYARYDGDRRALDESFFNLTRLQSVNFPSNEQMVYDTGSDLKEKFKHIITRNKLR
ncbi:hypothetical protein F7642_06555 [Tenacibaculum finnmarkense genomovar ulcerans]|uniref:hypothetical protein n=1 Tax=Tenacibaculum finnmarkense TaxID=2781243 RepID=UPI00187B56C7|nr:hypothetical protein [Tenacibaculum finnmarkense]MBE7633997.1 hypothetical protein [Tenacibaculum finnmarkense genomovar ulcerans]MCD8429754.1 hypothetical protein [Tenacibaculum finnmarkense genomovar ulcerans]MCG8235719.1 hypothetical protein [Tenacibaculum finnmarkense genomovar ulcerans]MCG8733489.1 hypothetical protein [Tenacibaculum finnmarkense]MCG8829946.1 hypothetical protein [Tenacibaculum finnmarkense]